MKTLALLLVVSGGLFAQTAPASNDAVPSDPSIVLAFGGGASQFSEPHYAMTGSIGFRVADGMYSVTSLDTGTKLDSTGARVQVSTVRTGMQKRLAQSGPLNLFASADAGVSTGGGNLAGALSGGGTITYDLPRHPDVFVYGAVRVLKSPGETNVLTAFSVGVGLRLRGK
jgi:hypothetical protein